MSDLANITPPAPEGNNSGGMSAEDQATFDEMLSWAPAGATAIDPQAFLLEQDLQLLAKGYEPIPEHHGEPGFDGWPDFDISKDDLKLLRTTTTWKGGHVRDGTAIRTEHTPAVDFDLHDAALVERMAAIETRLLGESKIGRRIGSKGFGRFYRTSEPFRSIIAKIMVDDPERPGKLKPSGEQIEIRGEGQKLTCYGPHRDTGQPYRWEGLQPIEVHRDELVEMTPEKAVDLARAWQAALEAEGHKVKVFGTWTDEKPATLHAYIPDDEERAIHYARWEMESGRGGWSDFPCAGHRYNALTHRAVRLHRLGVPREWDGGDPAVELLEEWAAQGDVGGYDPAEFINGVYANAAEHLFGTELPPPRSTSASEVLDRQLRDAVDHLKQLPDQQIDENKPLELLWELDEAEEKLVDPEMLVDGLIPDKVTTILYGDTNAGKTYFAVELASAVVQDRPAFGKFQIADKLDAGGNEIANLPKSDGVVVLCVGEDAASLVKSRLKAIERQYAAAHRGLHGRVLVVPAAIPIDGSAESQETVAKLWRDLARLQKGGRKVRMIVNDTLKKSLGPLESNKSEVAHAFSRHMDTLADHFECAVLVNAHMPKSGNGIGGSKDFENAASWTYELTGLKDSDNRLTGIEAKGVKARTGQQPGKFRVTAERVPLEKPVGGNTHDLVMVWQQDVKPARPDVDAIVVRVREVLDAKGAIDKEHGIMTETLIGELVGPLSMYEDRDAHEDAKEFYEQRMVIKANGSGGEWIKAPTDKKGSRGILHHFHHKVRPTDDPRVKISRWWVPS
jgi:RecA-family ATPase